MTAWWQDAKGNPLFRMAALIAVAVISLDQASKLWILHGLNLPDIEQIDLTPFFDLTYVENRGVSFGLFAGGMVSRVILTVLAIGVSAFVLHWAGRLNRRVAAIGAGFIVGGAIGNAIDRTAYGFVVDFFDFSGLYFPWVFNVADVCINVGVACLAYDAFIVVPKAEKAASVSSTKSTLAGENEDRPSKVTETKES